MAESVLKVKIVTDGQQRLERALKRTTIQGIKLERLIKGKLSRALKKAGEIGYKAGQRIKKGFELGIKGAQKLQAKLGGIKSAILGLGVGAGLAKAFGDASNVESLTTRVRLLGEEFKQLAGIEEVAAKSAEKFQLANSQVLRSYIDLGNRLGEQGASVRDLQNIYEGLNTVLVKNRSSTQEAASATLQLNQALGAGKLQGEEFRAINEAAPQVISEVARVLGVARGEVKKLAADGLVSSQVLIQALTSIKNKGADALEEGFTGAFGASRRLNKALTEFSETIGSKLLPIFAPLIEGVTALINGFTELPSVLQTGIVGIGLATLGFLVLTAAIVGVVNIISGAVGLAASLGALGVKLGIVTAASGKLALALAGLKVAMLALPWVALAAGLTAAVVGFGQLIKRQSDYNALINGTETDLKKYNDQIYNTRAELSKYEQKLKNLDRTQRGGAALANHYRKKIEKLRLELEKLERTYKVRIEITQGDVRRKSRKRDATDAMMEELGYERDPTGQGYRRPIKIGDVVGNSSTGSKSKSAPAVRESQLPQLQRDVELQKKLNDLNMQQLEAQLAQNAALVEALEAKKLIYQADKDVADIWADKDTPDDEKRQQEIKRTLRLEDDLNKLRYQGLELVKQEQQAIKDTIAPLEDQKRLLEAQLQGRAEEEIILQRIESIAKDLPKEERKRVEELVRGNAELEKQAKKLMEQKEFNKRIIERVGNAIEDSLIKTLDVAINKTEDLGEALQEIASNLLMDLGKMFLSRGISGAQSALFPDLFPMAEGGYVTGPTPALIGEGGEGETVIPDSLMGEAMARYSNGARGESVLPGKGGSANGGGGGSGNTVVNYNGPTLNFNGDDYVPASAVPGIIDAAARKGAKAGEQRTFTALRNSRSQRSSIGL